MNKSLKILSVNVSDTSGGAARAAYRIHRAVRTLGVDSRMFVKNKEKEDDSVLRVDDFDRKNIFSGIYRFVRHKIKNKLQHARWNKYPRREDVFLSDLRSTSIHGALQKIDYDVLHLHWINLRFLDLKELTRVNKPIVWTLHDCWPFAGICHYFYDCDQYKTNCGNCPFLHSGIEKDLSYRVWRRKKKFYTGLNLHIVTPSRWLAEAARQSSLFSGFPVTVIPNPIDTNLFSPRSRAEACTVLGLQPDKKYILYGAINAIADKRKGFIQLAEAFRVLEQQGSEQDIELLVMGADQPMEELKNSIPVTYLGYINSDEKMVSAYNAADLMVVPSLSENLSNVIMESLACGTPVVAFNIGGNSDMIEHQQNGYLAEAFSVDDLAEGILWCLEHNKDGRLSEDARKKVEDNFSMEKVAGEYSELYKSLVL